MVFFDCQRQASNDAKRVRERTDAPGLRPYDPSNAQGTSRLISRRSNRFAPVTTANIPQPNPGLPMTTPKTTALAKANASTLDMIELSARMTALKVELLAQVD